MDEMSRMTVKIEIIGSTEHRGFVVGGGWPMADEMERALCKHLGHQQPPAGAMLELQLTAEAAAAALKWVAANYPQCGCLPLDYTPTALQSAPPFLSAPPSPWRAFDLRVELTLPMTDDLVPTVAEFVDMLHEEVGRWHLDPTQPIGALAHEHQPPFHIRVVPAERTVFCSPLTADVIAALPEPMRSPYSNHAIH